MPTKNPNGSNPNTPNDSVNQAASPAMRPGVPVPPNALTPVPTGVSVPAVQQTAPPDSVIMTPDEYAKQQQDKEFLSEDAIIERETRLTLDEMLELQPDITPEELKSIIVKNVANAIDHINAIRPKSIRIATPKSLTPMQIAMCMLRMEHILCVRCGGNGSPDRDVLAIYSEEQGLYLTDEQAIRNIIRKYNGMSDKNKVQEVILLLRDTAEHRSRTEDPDLVAVKNGIFNYKTKTLMPFSPDYIFLTKPGVDYVDNPVNPVIHNDEDGTDWDVESWMTELSDDPAIVQLLWQMIGGIIRPFVSWNKSFWLYSNQGNNGKGTLCSLMRNLAGEGSYVSITLEAFSKDFQLEPLLNATSIITDENDVGGYIDKAANLKAVITNDIISINRKHKTVVDFRFRGLMVQCVNDYPRIRDTSDSFYRRQLFVPFTKCFTGREKKYIKDEYLKREDVLQYVLWKVLNTNFYEFDEPDACKLALEEYKEYNNPIEQFLAEILPLVKWDVLPFPFLYDMYKAWYAKTTPSGKPTGRNTFIKDIQAVIQAGHFPDWVYTGMTIHPGRRMDAPERLIMQYNLIDWANPKYDRTDPDNFCRTPVKSTYKGLVRFGSTTPDAAISDTEPETTS